jgi:Lrp/AsnC family leucine-responsive transcriptional regulator
MQELGKLDGYDLALLSLLQDNALLTAEDLAKEVALSPSAIARRVRRLRTQGIIVADRAVITDRIGPFLTAMVDIQLAHHGLAQIEPLLQKLQAMDEVQVIMDVAGSVDLALIVVVRDLDAFNAFTDETLAGDPAVQRYETRLIKRRRKFTAKWPIQAN